VYHRVDDLFERGVALGLRLPHVDVPQHRAANFRSTRDLFTTKGYTTTTVAAIADRGVAQDTVRLLLAPGRHI
jgi:hypothetical protein